MSLEGSLAETDAAHVKIAHVSTLSTTFEAASNDAALELRLALRASND